MASSDSGSQFNFDVEDIEITEVDTALIREMLDELEEEGEGEGEGEVTGDEPLSQRVDGDLRWLEEMNEMIPSLPSDEMMAWYPEDVVGSIEFGFAEYCPSEMYSAGIPSDDLSYGYLWDSS